jgi:hypothetical protein
MSKREILEKIKTLEFQAKQQENADLIHSEIFGANDSKNAKERAQLARNAAKKLRAEVADLEKRVTFTDK